MWTIVGILIAAWLLGYVIPDLLFHHLQLGAFHGSRLEARVALTFDDGPGRDTNLVLDGLAQAAVKGTFFVIAEHAQQYPDEMRRITGEGHEVGLHMRRHVSAFLLWPWQSFREIGQGLGAVEHLTGARPRLFRPPWGHVNIGTWLAMRYYHMTPVFWDIAPDDWRPDRSPEWMSHYVVQLAQPGTVVVMHDAGGPRERTARALPAMVDGLRSMGLSPVTVGEMTWDHSWFRKVWTWWEIRFTRGWNIETIPNSDGGEPYLRIGHITYRGRSVTLASGRLMRPGAPMGEIHFGNPALSQFSGQQASGLRAMHGVMRAFGDLARWLLEHPEYDDIQAIGGVTLLDAAHTIEKLGFERHPVHGWTKWSMWIYLVVLMAIYHRDGWKTFRRFGQLHPVMVMMDRDRFVAHYGKERPPRKRRS